MSKKGVRIKYDAGSAKQLKANLFNKVARVGNAASEAVKNTTEFAFEMAQENVPVETGALRDSGKVTFKEEPLRYTGIISYGDNTAAPGGEPTSKYAVLRHETYNPNKPQSYKWLERSLRTTGGDLFLSEIARLVKGALD